MIITIDDKRRIAASSAFIHERLAGMTLPPPAADSEAEKRFARWKRLLDGRATEDSFERRLRLAGKSSEEILKQLGPVTWNPAVPLPSWLKVLEEILSFVPLNIEHAVTLLPEGIFKKDEPLPFEELWLPCILWLAQNVENANADMPRLISEKVFSKWLRGNLATLRQYFSLPLLSSFDLQRMDNLLFMPMDIATSSPEGSTVKYTAFVEDMLAGGWLGLIKKYSVFARILAERLAASLDYFNEVLANLRKDMPEIGKVFCTEKESAPGRAEDLDVNLSDPHKNGRAVMKFTFASGLKLMYKPRSYELDARWEKFLGWCSANIKNLDFKHPRHLGISEYAWVECLENMALPNPESASAFYRRCGALLAITYVLNGYDFHQENLMAWGEYPVLVDLETALRPLVRPFDYKNMSELEKKGIMSLEGDVVMRTSMLPMWTEVAKDTMRDFGALTPDELIVFTHIGWLDINTDRMRRGEKKMSTESSPNIPHFNGAMMKVTDYIEDLLGGFCESYTCLMEKKLSVPYQIFAGSVLRYLPRNSQVYGDMISRLSSPAFMRDGALFSIELEGMGQPFLHGVSDTELASVWRVFELERKSLEMLCIPLFETRTDSLSVFDEGKVFVKDYYLLTAIEEVERRLEKISETDLDFQSQFIRAAFACRYPKNETDSDDNAREVMEKALAMPLCSDDEFMAAAKAAADEIMKKLVMRDAKPQWLTQHFNQVSNTLNIGPVDDMLYEGASGIGLFLAHYSHFSGDADCGEAALQCFDQFAELIRNENINVIAKWISTGYAGGIPGILWAALAVSRLLNSDKVAALLSNTLEILTPECMANDEGLDVITGAAGGILSFLALHKYCPDQKLLDMAFTAGEHLLAKRVKFKDRLLWGANFAREPLCGLGHGQSGFALALLKLFKECGDERFREAAMTALDYENSCYIPEYKNWPDFRINEKHKPDEIAFMAGWCSGAPGIGMARLYMLDVIDTVQIRADIENALDMVRSMPFKPYNRDHLCCGYAGRVEFLLEAANILGRPELMDEARRQFSFVINRAGLLGHYTFSGENYDAVFSPGLYTGSSGLGLTAMRIAKNTLIPNFMLPLSVI